VKFTKSGLITIRFDIFEFRNNKYLKTVIEDTGCGIEKEKLA